MSATTRGTFTIPVGDKEYILKPTLGAVVKLEAHFGGLMAAYQSPGQFSLVATCAVIVAGAGVKPRDVEALKEEVFQAGVSEVAPLLIPYLAFLLNPSQKDDDEEADKGNDQADAAP